MVILYAIAIASSDGWSRLGVLLSDISALTACKTIMRNNVMHVTTLFELQSHTTCFAHLLFSHGYETVSACGNYKVDKSIFL